MSNDSDSHNSSVEPNNGKAKKSIRFHFEKSGDFRTIHCDGAIGGWNPTGYLFMGLFAERLPIPKIVTYDLKPDGTLDKETPSRWEGRDGVFRELEVGVVLSEDTAKRIHKWLGDHLEKIGSEHSETKEETRDAEEDQSG